MRYIMCAAGALFVLLTASPDAENAPVLLAPGVNEIPVAVVNGLETGVTGLKLVVDTGSLPGWLSVPEATQPVDTDTDDGPGKLILPLTVNGTPEDAEAIVPCVLTDGTGKRWEFAIPVRVSTLPAADELFANYPNPFNPSTTIRYSLAESRHTTITVFNALGQEIAVLHDGPREAGIHTLSWDGRNADGLRVSSGVYFYRLRSGNYVRTMKMLLFE